jgi:apolipoprotein D and lipocalin family protein
MQRKAWVLPVLLLIAIVIGKASTRYGNLPTVEHVDLARYQGTWYEIARLPLYFEKNCAGNVTATYTLRTDGKIQVVNRCLKADGRPIVAKGTGQLARKDGPASQLKVTFFWPFFGDYWILDLDPSYRWAVVGSPDRESLWVLSRTPALDRSVTDRLLAAARSHGFDTSKMVWTRQ